MEGLGNGIEVDFGFSVNGARCPKAGSVGRSKVNWVCVRVHCFFFLA